ncbi:hypothetical protein KAS50_03435 [bacterium]|nr:hypothetical protein [bacterium]
MQYNDENEIRAFLQFYKVEAPGLELINRTKRLMREEMEKSFSAVTWQGRWLYMLVSVSLIMGLSVFYMFTVGTILSLTLPSYMVEFFRHSIFALTAAGGFLLAGMIMVFFFKQFELLHQRTY